MTRADRAAVPSVVGRKSPNRSINKVYKREAPAGAVYRGKFDPRVLYKAFMALHDFAA